MSAKGTPQPFESKADAERLVELLMPTDRNYGVVSGGVREVEGGWQVYLRVMRRHDQRTISRIINKHARGRNIVIAETNSRPVRH